MIKRMALMLAALLALMLYTGARAENPAESLYENLADLLFRTDNVTMHATADFSLDGEWFKTADGTWKQDRDRYYRQLIFTSPDKDGTTFQNGYTLIAAGRQVHIIEVVSPANVSYTNAMERHSILRRTVETEQLIQLGEGIVSQADLLLGSNAVTKVREGEYRITLDENVSPLANAALNQLARFAVKRYFGVDYDYQSMDRMPSVYDYKTLTEGLIRSMRRVSLLKLEAALKTDSNGNITQAEGEISVLTETAADGILRLDVHFSAEITDRGNTMVRKFDPEEYDVAVPVDEEGYLYGSVPNSGSVDELQDKAMEIWRKAGYDMDHITGKGYYNEGKYDTITFDLEGGTVLWTYFNQEGTAEWLNAEPRKWLNMPPDDPDEKTDEQLKDFMLGFLEEINPERAETVHDLKMEFRYSVEGDLYEEYNEYPLSQDDNGVLFVVRTGPEPRIEYFTTISNG